MKISALGFYPNINTGFKGLPSANINNKSEAAFFGCTQTDPINKPFIQKQFYIANSNISFSGISCSPGNFKIKTAYGIECPCCGQVMLTKKQSNAFVARVKDKTGADLQKELKKEAAYLRKNEQQIAEILIADSKENPDLNLSQLVALEAQDSIQKLENDQKRIISDIRKASKTLSHSKQKQLEEILDTEENLIDNSDDFVHFKRRNFVEKIESFRNRCNGKDSDTADAIFDMAVQMPTSGTSKDAFFVKYQRRTNADIARRLVLPAIATTEHIRPQSKNGKDSTDNYIPLCSNCNSARGNIPYNDWFKIHPEMPKNLQDYIYQISDMIKNREFRGWEFYDTYVDDVIDAVYKETRGALKLKKPEEITTSEQLPEQSTPERAKTIEEKREIWMAKYEGLTERLSELRKLRDELYSDEEFLTIIEYLNKKEQVAAAKQSRNNAHRNYMSASSSYKRIQREIKKAKSDNESVEVIRKLQAQAKTSKQVLDGAKAVFADETARYGGLIQERDEIKKSITTPDEIIAEIRRTKQQKLESEQKQASGSGAEDETLRDEQISSLEHSQSVLARQIETKKSLNSNREKTFDLDSPKSKKIAARYFELKAKTTMVNSIDMETFRTLFSDNSTSISPDFIIQEAKSAVKRQMKNILRSPIAQYYKTIADIEELEFKKRVIDSELMKIKTRVDFDKKLEALYRRKAEIQKKFSNVNIDETIARLQKEADANLQMFTDSFENFGGYQHSNPIEDTNSSSS